jgi:molecular chaperone GrpE
MNKPHRKPQDDTRPDASGNAPQDHADETASPSNPGSNEATEKVRELSVKEQLEAALAERDANRDSWLRAQAELENYRKRVQREAEEMRQYQALPLSRDLLPVLDNLRRALQAAERSPNIQELVDGVRLVTKQFEDALAKHGLTPIDAAGKPFDPNLHQALQQIPSAEHPPMTVLSELERGYVLKDRVVRPTSVIVSQAPPSESVARQDE